MKRLIEWMTEGVGVRQFLLELVILIALGLLVPVALAVSLLITGR